MVKTIIIDGKQLHVVLGKTHKEWWEKTHGVDEPLWDFPIEELIDGSVEINECIYYWLIDGRCYETQDEVFYSNSK